MKTKNIVSSLTLAGLMACIVGCDKTGETPPAPTPATNAAAAPAAPTGLKVDAAAADVKDTATKAADAATKTGAATATSAESAAQKLIDQAKSMVADKQYQPALDSLNKIGSLKLTAEQQTVVDNLKAQIQKLMAAQAGGALSGVLGK
jgi:hypothetical protein